MNMPNKQAVITRLKNNNYYNQAFKKVYGDAIFDNTDNAYLQMTKAIASFEKTQFFAPFDSKYDKYLQGKYDLTVLEDLGKSLFFSNNNTNCASCHQLQTTIEVPNETFSNYEYHNIGVPKNPNLTISTDFGLFHHTKNPKDKGKFKVPTLRNIAITAPYMHNGVFADLETVVRFYDKYINSEQNINLETGKKWVKPEVAENISLDELKQGKKLSERKIKALVAFLKTLTDKRYEHLLENN
jgi:cytochrome c peroxidase